MAGHLRCSVAEDLHNLRLGINKLRYVRNLVFIPIRRTREALEHSAMCTPLSTAVEQGTVSVQETGDYTRLNITNSSPELILGLSGTYLRGGGQDRALPMSILIPAHESKDVPVCCVERDRWRPVEGEQLSTRGSLTCSQVFTGTSQIQQALVWEAVANISRSTHTSSDTMCHGDTIEQLQGSVNDYVKPITSILLPDRTVGGLFLAYLGNGRMHCALDIFGKSELFRFYFPQLCESVALTAFAGRPRDGSRDYREGTSLQGICEVVFHNLMVAGLSEEQVPLNAGQLFVKVGGKSGCKVASLQYQRKALHSMMRWDALCV